jgi:hypothetical protein
MQILIEIGENLEETLMKVIKKSRMGYNFHESDPKFKKIYDYEQLPIDLGIDFKDYSKLKFLEKMQEILSRGSDPHDN